MNKQQIKQELTRCLKDRVVFALVCGSILKSTFRPESDVDLALYLDQSKAGFGDLMQYQTLLSQVIDREIDVVLLNHADLIITMQVLANGELIVNNDPRAFVQFKALKISQYLDYKISRKIIEDHMLEGRIYA